MNSFKNGIHESTHIYTRDQMIDWCRANIISFYKDDYESDGFVIYEKHQAIFCDNMIFIKTRNEELPFLFECPEGYYITGEKLRDINLSRFDLNINNKLVFDGSNAVNFDNFKWINNVNVEFHFSDIHPKNIHNVAFRSLDIRCPENSHVCDFNNYNTSIKIEEFSIAPDYKFKNLIHILELEILYMYILNTMTYNRNQVNSLEIIIYKYNLKLNKKDFSMDMAIDLIDAGFEDEV